MKGQSLALRNIADSGAMLTGFESWPVFFLCDLGQTAGLRFHVCTMGKTRVPTSKIMLRINN